MHWYVIRTKPHRERQADSHLRQLSVETFLPMLKQNKIIRRVSKTMVSPLFPGYLFARFDVKDHYRAVKYARGVLSIVQFGLKPAEVDTSLIEAIRERLEDGYVIIPKQKCTQQGQIVRIKGGPLMGLEAVFLRELSDQHRVTLLMKTLGFHAKLTLDIDQITFPQAL